ncbi:hypothetical protein OH491_02660 [Termitidicoccus mucosus]|uniref:hypothetical protein n=1 Tax=Termitidicoccus mucosus TaxID=1184151 RepID=UPI002FEE5052
MRSFPTPAIVVGVWDVGLRVVKMKPERSADKTALFKLQLRGRQLLGEAIQSGVIPSFFFILYLSSFSPARS